MRYPAWRETWVAQRVSDMKLNGQTGGVPFYGQWTAVASDMGLYENEAMARLHATSEAAAEAAAHLQKARDALRGRPGTPQRLEGMDNQVYDSIRYGEERLVLSGFSALTVSEWVGLTLATIPELPEKFSIPTKLGVTSSRCCSTTPTP